jgi:Cdc6-like AAA superfamily ATPase
MQVNVPAQSPVNVKAVPPTQTPVPAPSELFTGREEELNHMMQWFLPNNQWEPDCVRFVLYGLGGMGKTQIALKFLENIKHE